MIQAPLSDRLEANQTAIMKSERSLGFMLGMEVAIEMFDLLSAPDAAERLGEIVEASEAMILMALETGEHARTRHGN